jgi:hypothetical protein
MAAGVTDLYIEQGATFTRTLTLESAPGVPIDLTGYTVRGKIKTGATSTSTVATFDCLVDAPLTGVIVVSLTSTITAGIPTTGDKYSALSKYYYDIEMEIGGVVTRLLNGQVTVSPEVTK